MLSVPEGGYPQSSEVAGRPGGGDPRDGGLAKANREITVALILPTIGNAVFDELYNNERRGPTSYEPRKSGRLYTVRVHIQAKPSFFSFFARPRSRADPPPLLPSTGYRSFVKSNAPDNRSVRSRFHHRSHRQSHPHLLSRNLDAQFVPTLTSRIILSSISRRFSFFSFSSFFSFLFFFFV